MASNDTGRSEDLEALFGRLQGMPIQPKPINVNREEDLTHILSNLEQQIARIMTTQFDKFEERVQGIDILPNLEEQIARIMTTQLNRFENRVQSMYIYPTPVKPNQEPGLTGIVRNLEQQISRIMTAQHNKFQGIIGVVNSLRTDYEQMSTKFEKLQADFTVVQARLDVLSSADKHKEVHAGEEKASHTEMNDIRGGVATKSSEDDHDEIDAQLGM
ncbi:hypothetical protein MMC31_005958 [Peltigera leucophlebia]|nr:hypothetical protein [Peltigera leucophlebia]